MQCKPILLVLFLYFSLCADLYNQPVFKVVIGSAVYFENPDTSQFQYGPTLSLSKQLYERNSIELEIEHVYMAEEFPENYYAQRNIIAHIYWKRHFQKGQFGLGYSISPQKFYNQNRRTATVKEDWEVSLLGLGGSLTFTENLITFHVKGRFFNSDKFRIDSEFMYYLEASIKWKLLKHFSASFGYWRWYHSAYYDNQYQSVVYPSLHLHWKGILFDFSTVFSLNRYPSSYKNKFNFFGKLGYELLNRNKKK